MPFYATLVPDAPSPTNGPRPPRPRFGVVPGIDHRLAEHQEDRIAAVVPETLPRVADGQLAGSLLADRQPEGRARPLVPQVVPPRVEALPQEQRDRHRVGVVRRVGVVEHARDDDEPGRQALGGTRRTVRGPTFDSTTKVSPSTTDATGTGP